MTLTGGTANNTSLTISPNYDDRTVTIIYNAGNEMSFLETVFSPITPCENSSVKLTNVGYTLSETLTFGSITNRRTRGSTDGSSPHAVNFSGSEMSSEVRSSATLANAPKLSSGGIYMLEFNGTDLVGNVSSEVTETGVIYDDAISTFVKA